MAPSAAIVVDEQHLYHIGIQTDETYRSVVIRDRINIYSRKIFGDQRRPYLGNIILVEKMVRRPHGPLPYPDQYFIILTIASSD